MIWPLGHMGLEALTSLAISVNLWSPADDVRTLLR